MNRHVSTGRGELGRLRAGGLARVGLSRSKRSSIESKLTIWPLWFGLGAGAVSLPSRRLRVSRSPRQPSRTDRALQTKIAPEERKLETASGHEECTSPLTLLCDAQGAALKVHAAR